MNQLEFKLSETRSILQQLPRNLARLPGHFIAEQGILHSAALTYTTLFSLVPLMTLSYAMLALVPSFQGLSTQLEDMIFSNFLPDTGTAIQSSLAQFAEQARSLTLVGVIFLFITALLMMRSIEAALNRIWQVRSARKFLSSLLIYWAVVTLGPLLIGVGLALSSYLYGLARLDQLTGAADLLVVLPWLMTAAAFTLIYAVVPHAPVPWRAALISGIVAALAFELSKRGFSFFITQFPTYKLIYGAFAAVPIFLVWIFICWSIFIAGGTLSRLLSTPVGATNSPTSELYLSLRLLQRLAQAQLAGESVKPAHLLKQVEGMTAASLERIWLKLEPLELLARDEDGSWLIKRELHQIKLQQVDQLFNETALHVADSAEAWERNLSLRLQALQEGRDAQFELSLAELFFAESAESDPNREIKEL